MGFNKSGNLVNILNDFYTNFHIDANPDPTFINGDFLSNYFPNVFVIG